MAGSVFCGILALIFSISVLICFPLKPAVQIRDSGISCLEMPGKHWFVLESGSYTVNDSFGTLSMRSSAIPFFSKQYTYFHVTVNAAEGSFVMPVRTVAAKAERLRNGNSVELYGMVSMLPSDSYEQQANTAAQPSIIVSNMCLNDNGNTAVSRMLSAAMFAFLAIGFIWLAVKIYRVR